MIAASSLFSLLIEVVVAGLVFALLWWLVSVCALPAPFDRVARIILALFAVIFLINLLLGLGGHPLVNWR